MRGKIQQPIVYYGLMLSMNDLFPRWISPQRLLPVLAAAWALNLPVFAQMSPPGSEAEKAPMGAASVAQRAAAVWPDPEPDVELDGDLFHDLFLAELLLRQGQFEPAAGILLDAARYTDSAKLYRHATQTALNARAGTAALHAARTWLRAYPKSRMANRYVLQILVNLNRVPETAAPLARELAATPSAERAAAFDAVVQLYLMASDRAAAATLVEQALRADLRHPQHGAAAWAAVGALRVAAGQRAQAWRALEQAHKMSPYSLPVARLAMELLTQRAMAGGKLSEKILEKQDDGYLVTLIDGYLQRHETPQMRLALARHFMQNDSPEAALERLQPLLDEGLASSEPLPPSQAATEAHAPGLETQTAAAVLPIAHRAEAQLIAAAAYGQRGQWAQLLQAVQRFEPLAARLPASAVRVEAMTQGFSLAARAYLAQRDGDNALFWLDKIPSMRNAQPSFAQQYLRAQAHAVEQRLDAARQALEVVEPSGSQQLNQRDHLLVQLDQAQGHMQTAWQRQQQLFQRNPDDADVAYDTALMAEKMGNFPEMQRILRALIARWPAHYHALNALGYALLERGQSLSEARELIEAALRHAPGDPFITDSLGWLEYRTGNTQRAAQLLEAAWAARHDAEIGAHLGEVLWVLGQRERAAEIWRQALRLDAANGALRQTLQRLAPELLP